MWLRDDLPHDLQCEDTERPMARIMIYGYDSAVASSQNTQNIEDLATGLHSSLLSLVSSPQAKPILFIAHGLGGLVVKQVGLLPPPSLFISFANTINRCSFP